MRECVLLLVGLLRVHDADQHQQWNDKAEGKRERERARHRKEIAKQNKIDKKTHATHTHKDAMEIVAGRPFADFSPA